MPVREKALAFAERVVAALDPPAVVGALRKGKKSHLSLTLRGIYRATVYNKEGVPGIVLSAVSVVITLAVFVVSKPNVTPGKAAWVAAASFFFILLISVLSAWWAFHIMPPYDFAQIMISGRPTSEILQVIAYEIIRTCRKSLRHVASFENRRESIPRGEAGANDYAKALDLLAEQFASQHGSLLRISAMLKVASKESKISERRLRDLLFQYDPRLHVSYAKRYVHNAESLRELSKGEDIDELDENKKEKYQNLAQDNEYINQSAKMAADSAIRLIEYAALQPKILHLAGVHSTSQATKEYARAIAFVAQRTIDATKSQKGRWREQLDDGVSALMFLVNKQRTHSGYDLTPLCARACAMHGEKAEVLKSIGEDVRARSSIPFPRDPENPGNSRLSQKQMNRLCDLGIVVRSRIDAERKTVVRGFKTVYDSWLASTRELDSKSLLVTHGFSTTVREVFKRGITDHPNTDVFIIGSGASGAVDSRLMRNCLLELPDPKKFRNVTIGDEQSLLSFLDSTTQVMFVLGAECFDGNGRALHPRGLRIDSLRTKLANNRVWVAIVAEGFKCHRDLLTVRWSYQYHFDRIQLYKPEWIDAFITSNSRQTQRRTKTGVLYAVDRRTGLADRRNLNTFEHKQLIMRSRHHGAAQYAFLFRAS
jgi:hypothetical protein